jgi:hypothetical protein
MTSRLRWSGERIILFSEALTVAWSLYAASFWIHLREVRVPGLWVVPFIDKLLKALLAATLVWAILRRRPWAFWGVVIFAAYMGVPTLDHLHALLQLWAARSGSQALGALFQVAMESAQLVALVLGLKQLVAARTAA